MFASRVMFKRSVWKGPNVLPIAIPRVIPGKKMPPIKTQARSATILPTFIGLTFQVHNGKSYINVEITEDMAPAAKLTKYLERENHFLINKVRTSEP
ncbi:37S ribosomal protein S19, mitochondrial [Erysiphe necator]|nr:37S ribosomal protein S19, mitochondrial [Erysiphe necator]